MASPRNVMTVIEGVLPHIPEPESELRQALIRVYHRAGYVAPEAQRELWMEAGDALGKLGEPKTDWQKQIQSIWLGRSS